MKKFISRFKQEDGAVAIIMSFAMVVLLGFAAFATDVGLVNIQQSKFQTACDAAVLAAGKKLSETQSTTQATATAKEYIVKNGFAQNDITVTFAENNKKIIVTGTKQMATLFGSVLGVDKLNYTCTAAGAMTTSSNYGPAFNYLIYSGNTYPAQAPYYSFSVRTQNICTFSGLTNWVYGNVHSNYNLDANTSNVVGVGEAVGTVNGVNIVTKLPGQGLVPMPDFSVYKAQIKAAAIAAGQYYSGNFSIANASSVNVTQPLYVEGTATLTGISFSGTGTIYAGGRILITGTATNYNSLSKICMYSGYTSTSKSDSAIDFAGSAKNFTGILYAPNGSILVTGSNYTFYGNIIARSVDISGSNKAFRGESTVVDSFPYGNTSGPFKLTQ